jgi:hypothetical protein
MLLCRFIRLDRMAYKEVLEKAHRIRSQSCYFDGYEEEDDDPPWCSSVLQSYKNYEEDLIDRIMSCAEWIVDRQSRKGGP